MPEDDFTAGIFENVEKTKENEQFRSEYMRCNIHDFDKLEEGKELGRIEAARNLLMENAPEDMIARCTGLSLEKVRELAEELKIKA